ncbi:hypothetical protein JOF41_002252 [Saccharothrix coeruleofusca]|uniref:hypothetical protein n=1 Tax=Saccharothrix coeruleofusca TaxID=33919 RepID=UPI001AE7A0BB|nr:hypothetical protein [Saccharothrix coeruleofusca]MBP2336074.1 hypothetical protein [Saccharothrix coeruleofusca]
MLVGEVETERTVGEREEYLSAADLVLDRAVDIDFRARSSAYAEIIFHGSGRSFSYVLLPPGGSVVTRMAGQVQYVHWHRHRHSLKRSPALGSSTSSAVGTWNVCARARQFAQARLWFARYKYCRIGICSAS